MRTFGAFLSLLWGGSGFVFSFQCCHLVEGTCRQKINFFFCFFLFVLFSGWESHLQKRRNNRGEPKVRGEMMLLLSPFVTTLYMERKTGRGEQSGGFRQRLMFVVVWNDCHFLFLLTCFYFLCFILDFWEIVFFITGLSVHRVRFVQQEIIRNQCF